MTAASASQLDVVVTGGPEVVVQAKGGGPLYPPPDEAGFAKIKGDELQMCAGMALSMAYRPRLVAVRTPAGGWEIVY